MDLAALILGYRSSSNISNRVSELRAQGFETIYLFIDGPIIGSLHYESVIASQNLGYELLENKQVSAILISEVNLGQGKAIPTAIDWFLDDLGGGLIVEDDCQISKNAYSYLKSAINLLDESPDCYGICLSNLSKVSNPLQIIESQSTLFFNSWGWYTTQKRWQQAMIRTPSNRELVSAIRNLYSLSLARRLFLFANWYKFLLRKRYSGVNTWALNYTLGSMLLQGHFLMPTKNLVFHSANENSEHVRSVPGWYRHISNIDFSETLVASSNSIGIDGLYEDFMAKEVHQAGLFNLFKGAVFSLKSYFQKFFN